MSHTARCHPGTTHLACVTLHLVTAAETEVEGHEAQDAPHPPVSPTWASVTAADSNAAGILAGIGSDAQVVFIMEGPAALHAALQNLASSPGHASPVQGATILVDSGGKGVLREAAQQADGGKAAPAADALLLCNAVETFMQLQGEEAERPAVLFLSLSGGMANPSPAAVEVQRLAEERQWPWKWQVVSVRRAAAFDYLSSGEQLRVVVALAARFRGATTLGLLRQLAGAPGLQRVLAAPFAAAQLLEGVIAKSASCQLVDSSPVSIAEAIAVGLLGAVSSADARSRQQAAGTGSRTPDRVLQALLLWYRTVANAARPSESGYPPPPRLEDDSSDGHASQEAAEMRARCMVSAAAFPSARCSDAGGVAGQEQSAAAAVRALKVASLAQAANIGGALVDGEGNSGSPLPLVSVVITHYNRASLLRHAVHSVLNQTYPAYKLQLVVVDDGSPDPSVPPLLDQLEQDYNFEQRGWLLLREPNRYLGGARNAGARAAAGKYILFMDDDNCAKPHEVASYVTAMESSGADAMTSFVDFIWGEDMPVTPEVQPISSKAKGGNEGVKRSPSFVFLGASSDVGIFKNCYGDANSFYRASTFHAVGGYSEDRNLGYEDWEFYSRLVMKGYALEVVPQPLYHYRFTAGSMQKSTSYSASRQRALRAYLEQLDEKHSRNIFSA
ncbi:hypothetical protein CYMTET_19608 [Cymbomonas tetramitiformis]|uniref:Glycosyltransferase 2-like domain-containing protein n=1 Tax=Cymbomonas tetramitiformis TaxID=36881 RepID=A0AAE0L508_9CHLO|nr:hypothetical protein CYMTET_19608 [Cymbomonas tetramitiformis]